MAENQNACRVPHRKTLAEKFWTKVTKGPPDECWPWHGALDHEGYGYLDLRNGARTDGSAPKAHRVSWRLNRGEIPDGLKVLHQCDVRNCVNPAHLFLGTQAENIADMDKKGRRITLNGEHHANAKLTTEDVIEIRALCMAGVNRKVIAAKFSVTTNNVSMISCLQRWKHVRS